jgi:hypothetical protein
METADSSETLVPNYKITGRHVQDDRILNIVSCRAVSRQQPRNKQRKTPVVRQQIFNNATVGLQQWKICVFYVVRAKML